MNALFFFNFCKTKVCGNNTSEDTHQFFTDIYKEVTKISAPK